MLKLPAGELALLRHIAHYFPFDGVAVVGGAFPAPPSIIVGRSGTADSANDGHEALYRKGNCDEA